MTRADIFKLLGATAVLVVVVALITPPTKPVAPASADWRKQIPIKIGTPAPAEPPGPTPSAVLARRTLAPLRDSGERPQAEASDRSPPSAEALDRDERFPPDDEGERRYQRGYEWAERNRIDDGRDCLRDAGDPFTDGCVAALRDDADDRGPAHPPPDERFRRYGWGR